MSLPIIGALGIEDWFVTILLKCPCGQRLLLVGTAGTTRECTGCRRLHRLESMPATHPVTGELQWRIGTSPPRVDGGIPS